MLFSVSLRFWPYFIVFFSLVCAPGCILVCKKCSSQDLFPCNWQRVLFPKNNFLLKIKKSHPNSKFTVKFSPGLFTLYKIMQWSFTFSPHWDRQLQGIKYNSYSSKVSPHFDKDISMRSWVKTWVQPVESGSNFLFILASNNHQAESWLLKL